jgi:hypothetical protein
MPSPSHISTNGDDFAERFKKSGLKNCGGENISFSGGDGNSLADACPIVS